jgi:uncharacterized protein
MDDIKKKVYLDLFASPVTLLPVVGGLTALLASWALGGNTPLTFGGLASILGGVGLFASRLVFGLERLTEDAYQYVVQRHRRNKEESLSRLRQRLEQDDDPRTQALLGRLQRLYAELEESIEEGKISLAAHDVLERVDEMFHVCVDHLQQSFRVWEKSRKVSRRARQQLLQQREHLIAEVDASVEHLEHKLEQLNAMSLKKNKSQMSHLRAELDETIEVARRAENRASALGMEGPVEKEDGMGSS